MSDDSPRTIEHSDGEIVSFHYVKGNFYRALHVDGAYGGLTARGMIAMTVFNERRPVPQKTGSAVVVREGTAELGPEIDAERVGKDGIIRELDGTLYLSFDVARDVAHWLLQKLAEAKRVGMLSDEPAETERNDS